MELSSIKVRGGGESLKLLLKDLREKTIKDVRACIVGTYAVIAKIDEKIISFIDEIGAYALYYYQGKDGYIITNTYYHIGKYAKIKTNLFACMEELRQSAIYDNQTPLNNVFRLMGNEILEIDTKSESFNVKSIGTNQYILEDKNFDSIVQIIAEKMRKYAKLQELCKGEKIIFLTGGVDSRLTVACDLAVGIKPALGNWQGSPIYMNTKHADNDIMNLLATKTNLDAVNLDVSEGQEGIISQAAFEKYGEAAMIYGNNKKWFKIFEDSKYSMFDFGYFGEIIRNLDNLDAAYEKPMSTDVFSKMYMNRSICNYVDLSEEEEKKYYEYVSDKITKAAKRYGLNQNDLSLEDCMHLYLFYRVHADEKCCNFANNFGYCFNILGQKELVDLINQVPYEYRKGNKLNLALTEALYPDILNVKYYSHSVFKIFNRQKMLLEDDVSTSVKIKRKLRFILGTSFSKKYDSIKLKLKRTLKMENKDMENAIMRCLNMCNKINKDFPLKIDEKSFSYVPPYLAHISMLRMLSYIS